jgi:replicative DNA helicase
MAAAQGIHPLHFEPIEPQRTLIVDLENPDDSILGVCEPIRGQAVARVRGDYDPDRAWLWHEPAGIDLRSRRGRSDLEAVVAHVRPSLVCLGPLYKAYRVTARESDELAASEVMAVFDDLRTRYSFALLLEHHAPKGSGKARELMPYGSSLWLRWPEIGLQLRPKTPDGAVMQVGRWRGDRLENSWPVEIERSTGWPWRGIWPKGTFTGGVPTTARRDPVGGEPRRAEEALRDLPETPWGGESPPGVDPETGEVLDPMSLFGEEIPF